jgi:hypothetical protein
MDGQLATAAEYSIPKGLYAIPDHELDMRPDNEIDHDILNPKPVTGEKNVWFFWHSGYANMYGYTQRNIRAWQRRFSKHGWTIRVVDRLAGSPLNIANFLDEHDPAIFPKAFVDGVIGGTYGIQHTSDLVRWPLLLKYGGVYADVGMIQIGDLDRLWNETVGSTETPYEILSYNAGGADVRNLTNYFLASKRDNPLFARCHKLFLALWNADGGKTCTDGMHTSPLLRGAPLFGGPGNLSFTENGITYGPEEVTKMLCDYIVQGQVMTLVMGLVDEEDNWNGPEYVAKHVYAMDYMERSQLINVYTEWNGTRAWELMSLRLPSEGEEESADQKLAREIVEGCLQRSWGFKLAHGLIIRVMGETLGSLWRKHEGSDNVPGTYAHWLRFGVANWNQEYVPPKLDFTVIPPYKKGRLLQE